MNRILLQLWCLSYLTLSGSHVVYGEGEDQWIQEQLQVGLVLSVHGNIPEQKLFVATWRSKVDFFKYRHFPMIVNDEDLQEVVKQLKRHDKVVVTGHLRYSSTRQEHIRVSKLEVLEVGELPPPIDHDIPEVPIGDSLTAKVHFAKGRTLVVDWQNRVFPVILPNEENAFWRNDGIRLQLTKQKWPRLPHHYRLDGEIEVTEAVESLHNQIKTIQGNLVCYPKSPQIRFDVYAIEWRSPSSHLDRFITLMTEDTDEFFEMRDKVKAIWESCSNKTRRQQHYVCPDIKMKAHGRMNVVAPTQANVQIMLRSIDDIEEL